MRPSMSRPTRLMRALGTCRVPTADAQAGDGGPQGRAARDCEARVGTVTVRCHSHRSRGTPAMEKPLVDAPRSPGEAGREFEESRSRGCVDLQQAVAIVMVQRPQRPRTRDRIVRYVSEAGPRGC